MALPQARIDETRGLSLVTKDGEHREETRYIWTALDALDPDRKFQLETRRDGGEEVESRCLRRTPNYIPRCELTPLEKWFEPIGIPELAGDAMKDLVSVGGTPQHQVPENVNPGQFFRRHEPMMGVPHYPGIDLPLVIEVVGYRGTKEIEALRGVEWESGEAQRIQHAFFPRDWAGRIDGILPLPFRVIEDRIKEVGVGEFQTIGEEMRASLDRSRRWAMTRIGVEHGLLQTRQAHQFTYTYSRMAPQLLAQLEMEPRDVGNDTAKFAKEIATAMMAAQQQVAAPVNINGIIEQAVKAALLAHGIGGDVVPETKDYICDGCQSSFDTPQGLSLHKTRHCKANKPDVEKE